MRMRLVLTHVDDQTREVGHLKLAQQPLGAAVELEQFLVGSLVEIHAMLNRGANDDGSGLAVDPKPYAVTLLDK